MTSEHEKGEREERPAQGAARGGPSRSRDAAPRGNSGNTGGDRPNTGRSPRTGQSGDNRGYRGQRDDRGRDDRSWQDRSGSDRHRPDRGRGSAPGGQGSERRREDSRGGSRGSGSRPFNDRNAGTSSSSRSGGYSRDGDSGRSASGQRSSNGKRDSGAPRDSWSGKPRTGDRQGSGRAGGDRWGNSRDRDNRGADGERRQASGGARSFERRDDKKDGDRGGSWSRNRGTGSRPPRDGFDERGSSSRGAGSRGSDSRGSGARAEGGRSSGSWENRPARGASRDGGGRPAGRDAGRGSGGKWAERGPRDQSAGRDGGRRFGGPRDADDRGPRGRDAGGRGTGGRDAVRRDDRRSERDDGSRRGDRSTQRPFIDAPEIPDEIDMGQLDREVRQRLRTLSKDNAEDVGRHLIMAGALIEIDPELAYRHAQVAVARGGRVDIVREAGALTAYATGRYAEALREFRTVRRLSGSHEHLPLMADCERGLGRPERAIDLARSSDAEKLGPRARQELEIVAAGARLDLGEPEAAYVALKRISADDPGLRTRADEAMVMVLRALGRHEEAETLEQSLSTVDDAGDSPGEIEFDITVYDVAELPTPVEVVEDVEDEVDDSDDAEEELDDTTDEEGMR